MVCCDHRTIGGMELQGGVNEPIGDAELGERWPNYPNDHCLIGAADSEAGDGGTVTRSYIGPARQICDVAAAASKRRMGKKKTSNRQDAPSGTLPVDVFCMDNMMKLSNAHALFLYRNSTRRLMH